MSVNFFPLEQEPNRQPRYKSTAFAEGFLADSRTGVGLTGPTGTFSLWCEGVSVFTNRTMAAATDLGVGWLRCTILDTELAQHGVYQWQMTLKSSDNSIVLNDSGSFTL